MTLAEQEQYLKELEQISTARTEQLRQVMAKIQTALPDLEKLEQRLQSRGLTEESGGVRAIVEKLRLS